MYALVILGMLDAVDAVSIPGPVYLWLLAVYFVWSIFSRLLEPSEVPAILFTMFGDPPSRVTDATGSVSTVEDYRV